MLTPLQNLFNSCSVYQIPQTKVGEARSSTERVAENVLGICCLTEKLLTWFHLNPSLRAEMVKNKNRKKCVFVIFFFSLILWQQIHLLLPRPGRDISTLC